jgi:hypothetical protein
MNKISQISNHRLFIFNLEEDRVEFESNKIKVKYDCECRSCFILIFFDRIRTLFEDQFTLTRRQLFSRLEAAGIFLG